MKKITRATFKSFVKKNRNNLLINCKSRFDGMTDCVEHSRDSKFEEVKDTELKFQNDYNLGVNGIWLVGSSRDYFTAYEDEFFVGISVSNCCGSFVIAIRKDVKLKIVT